MQVKLRKVELEDREILANLLEKYDYEFSQYDHRDVNKLGLFGYQYLDCYWTDDDRFAYFIEIDGTLAGFIMVFNYRKDGDPETDHQIAEFFVMHKYRRRGVGRQAFFQVLDDHRGRWALGWHPKNIASDKFWRGVVNEYTKGQFELEESCPRLSYPDGSFGTVVYFDNRESENKHN